LCLALIAALVPAAPAAASRSAIVVDAQTGTVLYQKRADVRRHPASLAKMMTLYLVFEALDQKRVTLATKLRVSARAAGQPASKLGLKKGSTITVADAIVALAAKSANDVATVVGEALGGEEWRFAQLMTKKARALGMRKTNFRNASGLYNRRQLTSARDMARLARALRRDFPHHYHYFATPSFRYRGTTYENHNRLISRPDVDGLKTGYIRASGFNLAASGERNGRRVIAVVLGAGSPKARNREALALLDRGFSRASTVLSEPPPPPREKPIALVRSRWAIQVGAYAHADGAYAALEMARPHIPGIIVRADAFVIPVEEGDAGLFRARFVGVSESSARRACRILVRRKLGCEVVRHQPDPFDLADSN
jgi:D-alanyl-D-alanine carboxypeptidase